MAGLLATARPPFLLLTPACMAVGIASAGALPDRWPVWVALAAGILAHAAVNGLNEVLDFRSGLDLHTVRTPFSGGSGALPAAPRLAGPALALALGALAVSMALGALLALRAGAGLLLYGVPGVALVLTYTGPLNRHPLACLLAPGLGFGPVMVAGTHFALTGAHSAAAWVASVLPLALASNLLLVNQLPDVDADARAGRRHLLVVRGPGAAAPAYAALALAGWGTVSVAVAAGMLPVASLLALATVPGAFLVWRALVRGASDARGLLPWMGLNVGVTLVTPLLLAAGLRLDG